MTTVPTKRISGLARSFEEYQNELLNFTKLFYPDILNNLNDSSVGAWFIDLNASIGDNLSNYIDRSYQETSIDQAQLRRSLFSIARTKGLKIPGKKASLVECEIACDVPMDSNLNPNVNYLPIIRKGSQATGNGRVFEFIDDSDFSNQFSKSGVSNRQIIPKRDSNGTITGYTVKKLEVLSGSQTKIYNTVIDDFMVVPFMEIVLPEPNVLSIDSIIFKEGTNFQYTPSNQDFSLQQEFLDGSSTSDGLPTWKYFEVDSLLEDKLFLPDLEQIPGGFDNYPHEVSNNFNGVSVNSNVRIINGGTGYTTGNVSITQIGSDNNATGTVTVASGVVTAVTIVNGGTNYTNGATVIISQGSNRTAAGIAVVNSSGIITSVTVPSGSIINNADIRPGVGYSINMINSSGNVPVITYNGRTYAANSNNQFFGINGVTTGTAPITNPTNASVLDITNYNVSIVPGSWKTIRQKYITEYTDKGFMKIIFGAGSDYGYFSNGILSSGQEQIRRIINNDNMGVLPNPGWTMFIQYRIGGGVQSNVASNVINQLSFRNIDIPGIGDGSGDDAYWKNYVDRSITITNTSPSVSGRDEPSNDEVRYMIKYNNLAQNRCVTIQDYKDRIEKMPPLYGTPFRLGIIERNNIIYISILGIDQGGHLTDNVSTTLIDNMSNYLSEYKIMTDYVIIKPGKIVNLQIEADIIVNKAFNNNDVVKNIIETIQDFFDINQRKMGENIYISQLNQSILSVSGINNLIEIRVYNIFDNEYSKNRISQAIIAGQFTNGGIWQPSQTAGTNRVQVDLLNSEGILFADIDTMFEVRNINVDIKIRVKNN